MANEAIELVLTPYSVRPDVVTRWQNTNLQPPDANYVELLQDGTYRWVRVFEDNIVAEHILSPITANHWVKMSNWVVVE